MTLQKREVTREVIEDLMVTHVSKALEIDAEDVDVHTPLNDFGMDSMEMLSLGEELAEWLGFEVEATLLWYYPTIDKLSQHLAEKSISSSS